MSKKTVGDNGLIVIYEYGVSKEQSTQIIASFNDYRSKISENKFIGNFEERHISIKDDHQIKNDGCNVGVIEFEKSRIELRPKLDRKKEDKLDSQEVDKKKQLQFWTFLPTMLNKLYYYHEDPTKKLFLDPNRIITLPKGSNIVPLLTLAYVILCNKYIQAGIIKRYVQKEERLYAIRGRIDFNKLAKQGTWDLTKIPCRYSDLTFDNMENQIILWCAYKLLRMVRKIKPRNTNSVIVKKLREKYLLLG